MLAALKWRAKKKRNLGKRFFHLMDSQVNLGAFAKGRSSAAGLGGIYEQAFAVVLAANFYPYGGYCTTDDNPADTPSRW